MRDQWYSDKRDVVKWSVLLHLAKTHKADRIIQIAYFNPSDFSAHIEIDGKNHPVSDKVLSHFRKISNISGLTGHPQISIFDAPFNHKNRTGYLCDALAYIDSFHEECCVVFLDPDTGLEPKKRANKTHALNIELEQFWNALPKGSLLVCYQHQTNQSNTPWIEPKRAQFAAAIGEDHLDKVKTAYGPGIARDVVFFFSLKS